MSYAGASAAPQNQIHTMVSHAQGVGRIPPHTSCRKRGRDRIFGELYARRLAASLLARAVDDRALSQEILDAGRAAVKTAPV